MGDLISRQAAIDAIQKAYADTEGGEDRHAVWKNVGLTNALHIMQDLPAAQPKRETTTLRIGRTMNSVTMWYECAECGEPVDQEDAFCRRCGRGIIHE